MLSQAEARFINKLPKSINKTLNEKYLKLAKKSLLVSASSYSLDEFMLRYWKLKTGNRHCITTLLLHVKGWMVEWMVKCCMLEWKEMWHGCVWWRFWYNTCMYCYFTVKNELSLCGLNLHLNVLGEIHGRIGYKLWPAFLLQSKLYPANEDRV